jgi:hypothetical protein
MASSLFKGTWLIVFDERRANYPTGYIIGWNVCMCVLRACRKAGFAKHCILVRYLFTHGVRLSQVLAGLEEGFEQQTWGLDLT